MAAQRYDHLVLCCLFRTVRVTGLKPTLSKDILEVYFESKKRSGGGDIEDIVIMTGKGEALITFEEPEGKRSDNNKIQRDRAIVWQIICA